MEKYLLLLRGINVGGNNKLSMKALKEKMTQKGLKDVTTYINSGNVIFSSELTDLTQLKNEIETMLQEEFQLSLKVMLIRAEDFTEALGHAPSWWDVSPSDKNNVIFVMPPLTAEAVIGAVGACKPEYEQVAFYGSLIFWTAPSETFSKTRWSKVVKSSVYEFITKRNANTSKKLMQLCESGGMK